MTVIISRRALLATTGVALVAPRTTWGAPVVPPLLDHILLGCSDLEHGIDFVERRAGVRAAFGGVHPGRGTQNALLSLGERRYLEIIAPDPKQNVPEQQDKYKTLKEPRLIGWAAHPGDLEQFAVRVRNAGIAFEGPRPGSRRRPDGRGLNWKTLTLKDDRGGLLPFFIEWSADSIHPSADAPHGCTLRHFTAATPESEELADVAVRLQLDLEVSTFSEPALHATIAGPNGEFTFGS